MRTVIGRLVGLLAVVGSLLAGTISQPVYAAGDNNVHWNELYHSAPSANPRTELVPGESFGFVVGEPSGDILPTTAVQISILSENQDLTSANIRYWNGSANWVPLTFVKQITAAFRGQASHTYDLWRGTIPAQAAGVQVYYRIQANDGSASAYLKAANGQVINPLGQHVRGPNTDPDDYSYVVSSGPSATATRTNTPPPPTLTATRTKTPPPPTLTATSGPSQTPSRTATRTATSTATRTATSGPSPTPSRTATPGSGCTAGDGTINTAVVYHADANPLYRTPQGAVAITGTATLRLRTCRFDVQQVQVLVWKTGDPLAAPSNTYSAQVTMVDPSGPYDFWSFAVPGPGSQIDQWYQFRLIDGATTGYYRPASGNTGPGVWATSLGNPSWKLATGSGGSGNAEFVVPSWMQDAVIYQIFPDRFRDGDSSNNLANQQVYGPTTCNSGPCNTTLHATWTELPTQPGFGIDFYGGDLQGIIDKINAGYFNDLGVNTLYLNPIFAASSNHGYDTNDYYGINPRFGSQATFDAFMAAANAHGLRVILDGVFNHLGSDSKYIDGYGRNRWPSDLGACESATSPYRAWITTGSSGTAQCAGGWGWKGWYGYETIPELIENDPVKAFFYRGGSAQSPAGVPVARYWLDKGIAGWRFDVAQDITHSWWQDMRPYLKNSASGHYGNSEVLMLGEVTGGCDWGLYQSYVNSAELDSAMNYCFRDWAVGFANGNAPSSFDGAFNSFRALFGPSPWRAMMNLISSHDSPRALSLLNGNLARLKLITLLQMTLPGAPSVYYGDEVALPGGGDPDNRRTYPWADRGGSPDTGMYAHFRQLITLRNGHSALRRGDFQTLLVDDANKLYSYLRADSNERIVVVLNNGLAAANAVIPVGAHFGDGTVVTDLLNGGSFTVSGGNLNASVAAQWGRILVATGGIAPTATPSATPTSSLQTVTPVANRPSTTMLGGSKPTATALARR